MSNIVNTICEKDRVFGKLCLEAEHSYQNQDYFAAIACLFVLAEQVIKYCVDKNHGKFQDSLVEAKNKNIINEDEFCVLNELKTLRNKIFHENHYSLGLVINDKVYPIDEDETKQIIFEKFSDRLFFIVLKIINRDLE